MMKKLFKWIPDQVGDDKREAGIIQIIPLILLLLGLGAGVYLATHPQIFKPKASSEAIQWVVGDDSDPNNNVRVQNNQTVTIGPKVKFRLNPPSETSDGGFEIVKEAHAQSTEIFTQKASGGFLDSLKGIFEEIGKIFGQSPAPAPTVPAVDRSNPLLNGSGQPAAQTPSPTTTPLANPTSTPTPQGGGLLESIGSGIQRLFSTITGSPQTIQSTPGRPPAPPQTGPLTTKPKPTNLKPTGGEEVDYKNGIDLSWTNPNGVQQRQIKVIASNNGGPEINYKDVTTHQIYHIKQPCIECVDHDYVLLPGVTYNWKVRVSNKTGTLSDSDESWSDWSEATFKTKGASGSTIILVSPARYERVDSLTPTLHWEDSDKRVFLYEVQVTSGPTQVLYNETIHGGLSSPVRSYTIPKSQPIEENVLYYWRVRPKIPGAGPQDNWTDTSTFRSPLPPTPAQGASQAVSCDHLTVQRINRDTRQNVDSEQKKVNPNEFIEMSSEWMAYIYAYDSSNKILGLDNGRVVWNKTGGTLAPTNGSESNYWYSLTSGDYTVSYQIDGKDQPNCVAKFRVGGGAGAPAAPASEETPVNITPKDGETIYLDQSAGGVKFEWTGVPKAKLYNIVVLSGHENTFNYSLGDCGGFSGIDNAAIINKHIICKRGTDITSYSFPANVFKEGEYNWYLIGYDRTGSQGNDNPTYVSKYSQVTKFTVKNTRPVGGPAAEKRVTGYRVSDSRSELGNLGFTTYTTEPVEYTFRDSANGPHFLFVQFQYNNSGSDLSQVYNAQIELVGTSAGSPSTPQTGAGQVITTPQTPQTKAPSSTAGKSTDLTCGNIDYQVNGSSISTAKVGNNVTIFANAGSNKGVAMDKIFVYVRQISPQYSGGFKEIGTINCDRVSFSCDGKSVSWSTSGWNAGTYNIAIKPVDVNGTERNSDGVDTGCTDSFNLTASSSSGSQQPAVAPQPQAPASSTNPCDVDPYSYECGKYEDRFNNKD